MAAPTEVFVESSSITSATLIWTYSGTGFISVWRALHGGAFTEITPPFDGVKPGTTEYIDDTAETGVFYDYKLSDDNGGSFSDVVSVVIQVCPSNSGSTQFSQTIALPRPQNDEELTAKYMENILAQIEAQTNTQAVPQDCEVCSVNGAIVFDCSNGCFNFTVVVEEDINSISINQCEEGNIDWQFPPNTTRRICGWPAGMGFLGGECKNNPVVSGDGGRRMSSPFGKGKSKPTASKKGYPKGSGGGGSFGGSCPCPPNAENALRIKCCSGSCSLNCSSGSGKKLQMKICGGKGPYSVSHTGDVKLSKNGNTLNPVLSDTLESSNEGSTFWVVPPANTGSAVAGIAYRRDIVTCLFCTGAVCTTESTHVSELYGCNDQILGCTTTSSCGPFPGGPAGIANCCPTAQPVCPGTDTSVCQAPVGNYSTQHCDSRTAPMIAAGCNPCGIAAGDMITVTDSLGVSATIILSN